MRRRKRKNGRCRWAPQCSTLWSGEAGTLVCDALSDVTVTNELTMTSMKQKKQSSALV